MRTRVCHVVSHIEYSLFLEAIAKFLDEDKYELSFVFMNPTRPRLADILANASIRSEWIPYRTKKNLPRAVSQLAKLFRRMRPDIVHTHLVESSLAGLTAAAITHVRGRVHTRHHGSEAHKYYPHGVYYDKYVSFLSRRIMATTESVRSTLVELENVDPSKIDLINYGYDLNAFSASDDTVAHLRMKYNLSNAGPIIGVISRFVHWKGVQFVIPAFARFSQEHPNAKLVLAGGAGNFAPQIEALLQKHLRPEQYVEIEFEPNVFGLYKIFDAFVHVPIGPDFEAFGQTYIEAMYVGVPSAFTLSGIANDIVVDGENAIVVPYCDSDAIFNALSKLMSDKALREKLAERGRQDVIERFSGSRLASRLDALYTRVLS